MWEEASAAHISATHRERLVHLARALEQEDRAIDELCQPLAGVAREPPASWSVLTSLTGNPLSVMKYGEHLFRDWVWGGAENAKILNLVEPLLPPSPEAIAVFGAGTARFALDIAASSSAQEVCALDVNLLPFLVADRIMSGRAVSLPEFPLVPLSSDCVAVPRELSLDIARPKSLQLVLADAFTPPFEDHGFDVVVTPWFIDAVGASVGDVVRVINRQLRPGGIWINVGPLQFGHDQAQALSIEEVHTLARENGFELLHSSAHDLVYFDSPISGTRRIDRTYVFSARRIGEVTERGEAAQLDPSAALPVTSGVSKTLQHSVMMAGILSLVDGRRTLTEVADAIGRDWGVEGSELLIPLRELLSQVGG